MAFGTPWRGKEGQGENIASPLKAITLLSRGKENRILPATEGERATGLFSQTLLPVDPAAAEAHLALLDDLATRMPMYHLFCNMESEAARVAYLEMEKGEPT